MFRGIRCVVPYIPAGEFTSIQSGRVHTYVCQGNHLIHCLSFHSTGAVYLYTRGFHGLVKSDSDSRRFVSSKTAYTMFSPHPGNYCLLLLLGTKITALPATCTSIPSRHQTDHYMLCVISPSPRWLHRSIAQAMCQIGRLSPGGAHIPPPPTGQAHRLPQDHRDHGTTQAGKLSTLAGIGDDST